MLNLEQIEEQYQKYRAWSDYLGELEEKLSNYKIEHIYGTSTNFGSYE